jgi:putative RecB family exonuclease
VGIKEKYSVTADILSFQLCSRQYGFFAVRKYQPAHVVQIWFGTIIHQVLDKLHMHYSGLLNPQTSGQIPSDNDVDLYFNQVEDSLRARGIKAINRDIRETALKVLKIFNRIEGPTLYPNVVDTECTLQTDRGNYILHGIVDVLRDVSVGRDIDNYDSVEIWDYKGSKFPDINRQDGQRKLERYTFQMLAYAELYRLKKGRYPLKGVLYFMNELNSDPEPNIRPSQAVYEIDFRNPSNIHHINQAMSTFSQVVNDIEQCKQRDRWDSPQQMPDKETCDICDLRWNCPTARSNYSMRYP